MPPKRKRNDPIDGTGRPSPHRPSDTTLGQHDRDNQDNRRRSGAGNRNNRGRNGERRPSFTNHANRGPISPTTQRPPSSSSQAAAPPPTPTMFAPQINPPAQIPRTRAPVLPSKYSYVVLNDARLAAWQQTGRQEVVQHGVASRDDEDVEEISTISQEFARAVLENRLDPADAGACMKEILGPDPGNEDDRTDCGFDAHSLFADSISVFVDTGGEHDRAKGIINPLLTDTFRDFVLATEVSAALLRQVLEVQVVEDLRLARHTFSKLRIRHSTNSLYRQSNYNLLREESEGFAKLITELYYTSHNINQEQLTKEQVQAGFERVKGLIGTFDLDVGRVLDIVFDVFASTMMRTFRYFTMFLRVSSWWPREQSDRYDPVATGGLPRWALPGAAFLTIPGEEHEMVEQRLQRDKTFWDRAREIHLDAFFELGGRRVTETELEQSSAQLKAIDQKQTDAIDQYEWIKSTKTLPPPGNRVAAQLYGFKLRYFVSQARDKDETIPANLYFLAAYLIKIGFISLPDLYAHVWPSDDKMESVKERRAQELEEKEKKDRQGAEPNALLKAGALPDDMPSAANTNRSREIPGKIDAKQKEDPITEATAAQDIPDPKEVLKIDLLHHLLLVGAIPEALFILGRINWLTDAYPDEVIVPINRILLYSIDKIYQTTLPQETDPVTSYATKKDLAQDHGMPKGALKMIERPPVKALKWPLMEGTRQGILYEHYLKEWTDNIPVCQTVDDVFTLCGTLLNVAGVHIGKSSLLLKKLTGIGTKSLREDKSTQNLDRWRDLLKRTIFPALNLTSSNVDVVNAVWNLLNHFPVDVRYNIYAECYEGSISRVPAMAKAFKYARLDTLAVLKRLSKENLAKSAKSMAKVALFSPGIVCKVALDQIEAYSNLIEAFVECTRYFTDLGYDVLVWSLMSSLGGRQRSRTQEGSVLLTSKWLQALSKFSGKVFRRYSNMDPTPVIQYVNNQLACGNSTDLVILREFVTSMGGIVSDVDFTDTQLAALSGGEELRKQTFINLGDKRFESGKSATRLMQALVHTKLAPRLLTNMAQYRQSAIYNLPENETHIKYLANVIDDSQQALVQFVELLRSNLPPDQFDQLMPSIPRLLTDFGLDANLAFLIGRVSLAYYLTGPGATAAKVRRLSDVVETAALDPEGDVAMDAKYGSRTAATFPPAIAEDSMVIDDEEAKYSSVEGSAAPGTNARRTDHFSEVLRPIISTVQTLLPPAVWDSISPDFFVLFWSLQTSDLGIPASSYNAESLRLQKEQDFIKRDRSDMSRSGRAKAEQRKAEITQLASKLGSEATQCQERVSKTKMLLLKSAPTWIGAAMSKANAVADVLIEDCIIPRILLAPSDADFCFKIIKFMHDNQVTNFNIMILYDRLFTINRLRSLIFGCTVREAEFLGRFIKLTLGDLSRWHKSKDTFEKEATKNGKHSAFLTPPTDDGQAATVMEHGHFQDQLWTWHRNLATVLKSCLQGTEWLHIRNAITVLKVVLDHFPAVTFHGKQFLSVLQQIAQREAATKNDNDGQNHRVDLSVTANTAASALKKYESKWVIVQAFRPNLAGDSFDEKAAETTKNTKSFNLSANSAEFKPAATADGSTRIKIAAEDEDGEVQDSRLYHTGSSSIIVPKIDSDQSLGSQNPSPGPQRAELAKGTGRSSTPPTRSSNASPAPHGRRELSRLSTIVTLPPGLPSRPDVPMPGQFKQDERGQIRMSEHGHLRADSKDTRDTRDARGHKDTREPKESRDARSGDAPRSSRGRESQSSDRRPPLEPPIKEPTRSDRERSSREDGPPRWEPPTNERPPRPPRDRVSSSSGHTQRQSESGRLTRDHPVEGTSMQPPSLPETPGPAVNPERARLINANEDNLKLNNTPTESINPARAALINDGRSAGRSRDDSRDRNSRQSSPSRRERPESRSAELREERSERPRFDHDTPSRNARNEPLAPSAPRGDREQDQRSRDLNPFAGASGSRGDADHTKQDPNYGRLNAMPSTAGATNPPDAPRGRGRNMVRGPAGSNQQPPARGDSRHSNMEQPHRGPSPDRGLPPSGPASSRARRGPMAPPPGNIPQSTQSAASSPTTGIHPDRLRHLDPAAAAAPVSQPPFPTSSANSVGVHPDRLGRIDAQPPSGPAQQRHAQPLQTPERSSIPTGPGGRQVLGSLPATPSSDRGTPNNAPTGPSATNDRSRGNGRRQLAGINNLLQGAQAPEPPVRSGSLRGRSSRTNLAGSDAQVLTGASPISTPVQERPELLTTLEPGRESANGDERSSRSDRDRSRRHHEHGERSSRSHHEGRDRSPRRNEAKEHRESRERDPTAHMPNNGTHGDRDPMRRSGREASGTVANNRVTEPVPVSRANGPREPRHGDGRSGGRHDDHVRSSGGRGGGGGGGAMSGMGGMGGVPGEPRDDGGRGSRKRRSEEGAFQGPPGGDGHKRPRHQR